MTIGAILLFILFGASFAAEPTLLAKRVVLPSGEQGYSIRCDNLNMNLCYEKAGEICFRGYDVINETKDQGVESHGSAYAGPGIAPGTSIGFSGSNTRTTSEKGLLIQCKDPAETERERRLRSKAEERAMIEQQAREDAERAASSRLAGAVVGGIAALFLIVGVVASR